MVVIFKIEVAVCQIEQNGDEVTLITDIAFMSSDIVSYQEALLSLNKIVYLQIENSQTNDTVCVLIDFLIFFELIQGCGVGSYPFIPHFCFKITSTQLKIDFSHVDRQHSGVLFDVFDDLGVVSGCSFILEFFLFAMGHQEAPFCLGSHVDKAIFFFVVIKEIFQFICFLSLN